MTKPITPNEVALQKRKNIPEAVIEVWNALIACRATGRGVVRIYQEEIVNCLLPLTPGGEDRQLIFKEGWLDIEPLYREAGWTVVYDKPSYADSYPAVFTFEPAQ